MKWNWGTKIGLTYTVFVVFILGMVYLTFGENFDLVTEDYYAQEVKYQGTIDNTLRAKNLDEKLKTSIEGGFLKINFPQQEALLKGSINCFRPSDETKDFTEEFEITNGVYKIPLHKFIKGKYTLKIKWKQGDLEFYKEQVVILP